MELTPFTKVSDVPTGQQTLEDIFSGFEFIDVADICILNKVRGIRKSYYTGLTAYMFDAQLKFSFQSNYKIQSIEFRKPFDAFNAKGLFYNGNNLFLPTLQEVEYALEKSGVKTQVIDVGLKAPDIGLSFFSNDFEQDLNASLDAVTVHFD